MHLYFCRRMWLQSLVKTFVKKCHFLMISYKKTLTVFSMAVCDYLFNAKITLNNTLFQDKINK